MADEQQQKEDTQEKTSVIDISRFFGGKTLSSSNVKVNKNEVLKTQPSFIAAPELASLLDVVATSVETKNDYEEKIKSDERARLRELEERNASDNRFRRALEQLTSEVGSIKNSYFNIMETLEKDRKLREKEIREREDSIKSQLAEFSKQRVGESLITSAQAQDSFTGTNEQEQQQESGFDLGKFIGTAAALGVPGFAGLFGEGDEDGLEPGSFPGGQYDATKLTQLARSAGFPEKNIPTAVAVALAESGGDPTIDTVKSGTDPTMKDEYSIGLWQINWLVHKDGTLKQMGVTDPDQLRDPATNAKAAVKLSGGSDFTPWSAYENGNYRAYMKEAQDAYQKSKPQSSQTKPAPATPATVQGQQTSQSTAQPASQQVAMALPTQQSTSQIAAEESTMQSTAEPQVAIQKDIKTTPEQITPKPENQTPQVIVAPAPAQQQNIQPTPERTEDLALFSSVNTDNLFMTHTLRELNMA